MIDSILVPTPVVILFIIFGSIGIFKCFIYIVNLLAWIWEFIIDYECFIRWRNNKK